MRLPGKVGNGGFDLFGVVEGDVHDIGKNLVKLMFKVTGWTVYDLGKDVPLDKFIEEMIKTHSQEVGISALMTTSISFDARGDQGEESEGTDYVRGRR